MEKVSNKVRYPEAWAFFIEHARNLEEEPEFTYKYRIPKPDMSGDFLYANTIEYLWISFKEEFYKPRLESHSVYGAIQYIVNTFNG